MTLKNQNYLERILDKKIETYLKIFKAINIVGPKWCGKTWSGLAHAKSLKSLTDESVKSIAKIDPYAILKSETPLLIDEWQIVPELWDAVRNECDMRTSFGNFILTGSTRLMKKEDIAKIFHTGTGRIIRLKMYPMTYYEFGKSLDLISLKDLYDDKNIIQMVSPMTLQDIAKEVVVGGWPAINGLDLDDGIVAKEYLNSIIDYSTYEDMVPNYNKQIMKAVIESLARNESTYASTTTILKDINKFNDTISRPTLDKYINILENLYIISNQKSFSINYRSSSNVGTSDKRHLIDPSLAAAAMNLNVSKLLKDLNTFGFLFESLVYRDLCVYMDYYGGDVLAFRDTHIGDEVDAILQFDDGEYGAVEIKLGNDSIKDAIKSLNKFENGVSKKPLFKAVIVGVCSLLYKDKDSGVWVIPYNCLGMHADK